MCACTRVRQCARVHMYVFMYVHVRAGGEGGGPGGRLLYICIFVVVVVRSLLLLLFFKLFVCCFSLLLFVFFGWLGRGVTQGAAGFALGETNIFHTQQQGRSRPLEARQNKAQSLCKNVHTL